MNTAKYFIGDLLLFGLVEKGILGAVGKFFNDKPVDQILLTLYKGSSFYQENNVALRSPRTKRSKAEVEQEFSALAEQIANEKSSSSSKNEMLSQIQEAEVRATVSEITVEVIAKKLSDLNVEVSRTLSNLSEKMNSEVDLLRSLKEAVALESKELHRLHRIDIAATSIDQLVLRLKSFYG
jgi:SMC interacting uncharacterized protein involved in chromosome segregation